jgi:hypothetical protein
MLWIQVRYAVKAIYSWLFTDGLYASSAGKFLRITILLFTIGLAGVLVYSLSGTSNRSNPTAPIQTTTTIYSYFDKPANRIHARGACAADISALNNYIKTNKIKIGNQAQILKGYQVLLKSMLKTCPAQVGSSFINTVGVPWVGGLTHSLKPIA